MIKIKGENSPPTHISSQHHNLFLLKKLILIIENISFVVLHHINYSMGLIFKKYN